MSMHQSSLFLNQLPKEKGTILHFTFYLWNKLTMLLKHRSVVHINRLIQFINKWNSSIQDIFCFCKTVHGMLSICGVGVLGEDSMKDVAANSREVVQQQGDSILGIPSGQRSTK